MSLISMKARDQMWQILHDHKKEDEWATVVFAILAIPEIAIVDREAKLPIVRLLEETVSEYLESLYKEGWVKEVKD